MIENAFNTRLLNISCVPDLLISLRNQMKKSHFRGPILLFNDIFIHSEKRIGSILIDFFLYPKSV